MSFEEYIKQADKYYTSIGVIILIFLVIVVYLFWIDRKISKLESNKKDSILDSLSQ